MSHATLTSNAKSPLRVVVKDGMLVISIGVETLKWAAENCEKFWLPLTDKGALVVGNVGQFAMDVRQVLRQEEEDGTTPVHLLLDKAFESVMENGAEGLDFEAMEVLEETERRERDAP